MNDVSVIIFGTILFLIITVAFLMAVMIYQKRLMKEKGRIYQMEAEMQNRVIAAIIDTQEIERRRMSEDLHDDLSSVTVAMRVNQMNLLKLNSGGETQRIVRENEKHIVTVTETIRNVAYNLMPPQLRKGHLRLALLAMFDMVNKGGRLKIISDIQIKTDSILPRDQVLIYRIVNEWLSNLTKHSGAKQINFIMSIRNKNYFIAIQDDGRFFDLQHAIEHSKGLGLMSMHGRLSLLGGTHHFTSLSPIGTRFEIEFPIKI